MVSVGLSVAILKIGSLKAEVANTLRCWLKRLGGTYSSANLNMIFPNRIPIIHRIKSRHLIDSHRRHLEDSRNLIHDAQARKTCLALTEIEKWHHSGFLVLWWVAGEDLFDDGLVLGGEGEGNGGVVLGGVAVL